MRKLFKSAAALAVGCALLSTSAFAEGLAGTPAFKDNVISVEVTNLGEEESTILVLKGELQAMPQTVQVGDILYIDQMTAKSGVAAYSMNVGTYDGKATVFAGATSKNEAALLGVVDTHVAPAATGVEITKAGVNTTLNVGDTVDLVAAIVPNGAEGVITWSVSKDGVITVNDDGKVTAVAAGTASAIATIEGTQLSDSVEFTVQAANKMYGDVDGNKDITTNDAVVILKYILSKGDGSVVLGPTK